MSVRKRKWTTADGVVKEAWLVDYVDQHGKRHAKTFSRKKEADAFASTTHVEVRGNIHVADSDTITVAEAGKLWLTRAQDELERGTHVQYRQHLDLHITPFIGTLKLSKITVPLVRKFMDDLKEAGRSPAMVKGVKTSLGSILAEAQERGFAVRNPVRDMSTQRRGKTSSEKRRKKRLEYGVDIPTHEEIRAILDNSTGRWRPLLMTAVFTGLRSSELRGLRWVDVDLDKRVLHVRQRADSYHVIGLPKSEAGQRSVPLPPNVVNTLKEWKLACPKGKAGLVFPNTLGNVEAHSNIVKRGLIPPQIAAGLTITKVKRTSARKPVLDEDGKEQFVLAAKYEGLHALRHWFASWCINREKDNGLELPPKLVQTRLGHSTIAMTLDTYGHLFPSTNDDEALAKAEAALLAPARPV
jgi:integrase